MCILGTALLPNLIGVRQLPQYRMYAPTVERQGGEQYMQDPGDQTESQATQDLSLQIHLDSI